MSELKKKNRWVSEFVAEIRCPKDHLKSENQASVLSTATVSLAKYRLRGSIK